MASHLGSTTRAKAAASSRASPPRGTADMNDILRAINTLTASVNASTVQGDQLKQQMEEAVAAMGLLEGRLAAVEEKGRAAPSALAAPAGDSTAPIGKAAKPPTRQCPGEFADVPWDAADIKRFGASFAEITKARRQRLEKHEKDRALAEGLLQPFEEVEAELRSDASRMGQGCLFQREKMFTGIFGKGDAFDAIMTIKVNGAGGKPEALSLEQTFRKAAWAYRGLCPPLAAICGCFATVLSAARGQAYERAATDLVQATARDITGRLCDHYLVGTAIPIRADPREPDSDFRNRIFLIVSQSSMTQTKTPALDTNPRQDPPTRRTRTFDPARVPDGEYKGMPILDIFVQEAGSNRLVSVAGEAFYGIPVPQTKRSKIRELKGCSLEQLQAGIARVWASKLEACDKMAGRDFSKFLTQQWRKCNPSE